MIAVADTVEMQERVRELKKLRHAIVLAHNYQVPEIQDIALGDLRSSAGVGLRYRTPIGPIRLDWGYVLDREVGEGASRFHLSIGHAF